ncbi:STAS domain-containing protein [Lentzea flaviverrucosa]|uniref:Anti-sigma factor antagonist n=1 Tax=Lentzea flaviverrucosa TaxID=200379 RepID=A0A1H9C8L6_9PSEU|nr:STAS domain-containing protein [Lentzea flaviverrucosa]RDI24474.1 anti-anti-sigma factor [Lentzea flaviverrucosa]SEP97321.1 anti-anti-sigma factor [Lentzea flaviverrucosa]
MAQIDVSSIISPRPGRMGRRSAELLTTTLWAASSGAIVVSVSGEVDMITCVALRDRFVEQLRLTHHLVVDLSEVSFLGAAGLTVLVEVREMAQRTGTGLCVVACSRQVRCPLTITGLSDVLDLHLDVGEALTCQYVSPPLSPAQLRLVHPRQSDDLP